MRLEQCFCWGFLGTLTIVLTATAAMIPISTMTAINSMSVNPPLLMERRVDVRRASRAGSQALRSWRADWLVLLASATTEMLARSRICWRSLPICSFSFSA